MADGQLLGHSTLNQSTNKYNNDSTQVNSRPHYRRRVPRSRWINVGNRVVGAKTANAAARTASAQHYQFELRSSQSFPSLSSITATHLDTTAKMRAKWRKKRVRRLKRKRRKTRARSK
ncbi:hypothetical protein KCU91_g6384, partial [Aureobasidium melanogenum]